MKWRSIQHHAALPLVLLVLFTIVLTWPTAATLRTHVVDRQDPLLNSWIMAWEAHQVLVDPLHLYDGNIFYPHKNTLAFSETLLSTSALVMPLQWFTGEALLSYNVAFLLSFFTTALGSYLLAWYLTGHRGAALLGAVAFTWSPYRMGHLSQVQLLAFGWLPLALLYLDRLLRGRGRWGKNAFLLSYFFLMQALASFYAALFSAAACALYAVGWLLLKRSLSRTAVLGGVLAALLVALVVAPVSLPYFDVQESLGAGWTLQDNERFSASIQAYALAPRETWLWGPVTSGLTYTYGPCCPPDTLFPGVTLVLLSGFALFRARGGRRIFWLLLGGMGFLLSLGPTFTIQAQSPTGFALPYRWFWEYVPGFTAIRAPVRWSVLLTLALSMLAALGAKHLLNGRVAPLLLVLVLAEFAVIPLQLVRPPENPASLAWLREQPPTRIVELPLVADRPTVGTPSADPRLAWRQSRLLEAQYFSTEHWHSTPDGYSGYVPERHGDFAREMESFPSARSLAMLRGLDVRYVVLHEDDLSEDVRDRLAGALPEGVHEIERFEHERILEVLPAANGATPQGMILVSQLPPREHVTLPIALVTTSTPYVSQVAEALEVEARWYRIDGEAGHGETVRVRWPLLVEDVAVLDVPLTTPETGEWILQLSGHTPDNEPFTWKRDIVVAEGAQDAPNYLPVTLERATTLGEGVVELNWRTRTPLSRHFSLSARLVAPDGEVVAQQDGAPGGPVPTISWQPGTEYAATWTFDLPPGSSIEEYDLVVLWYDPESGQRVYLWDGKGFVEQVVVD